MFVVDFCFVYSYIVVSVVFDLWRILFGVCSSVHCVCLCCFGVVCLIAMCVKCCLLFVVSLFLYFPVGGCVLSLVICVRVLCCLLVVDGVLFLCIV